MNLFEQTTKVLEWPRLLDALAGHARSTMGATRCRALELATDLEDAIRRQQEFIRVLFRGPMGHDGSGG